MKRIDFKRAADIFCSLRTQLIAYYMSISLLVLGCGAYFSYSYILDILKKNSEKYLLQQFSQADYNIHSVLNDVDRLSKIFIYDDAVQQFLQDNYNVSEFNAVETQNAILKRIAQFISNYEYINSIYIFTENGGGIGGSETYTSIVREESDNRFFESGMYESVRKAFPQTVLEGGMTEDFFRDYPTESGACIFSVARGIKPVDEPGRSASLVFNINEKYIASIYTNSGGFINADMYIVDETGAIVSGSGDESLGRRYVTLPADKNGYGSFTSEQSGEAVQVVYYKLRDTDLYLIGEIPLEYFARDINVLRRVMTAVLVLSAAAIFAASFFWIRKITRPINIVAAKMRDVGEGNLGLTLSKIPRNEFGLVIRRFNEMSVSIAELIRKNDEIQEGKREMEIEALQLQINPHFLYNTLNMIKWMAANINAKNIVDCVVALGNLLNPVFKSTAPMCTIKEELSYLESYIKIINWRFGNNVGFNFDIREEYYQYKLPRFILQPIVENSLSHGLRSAENRLEINIHAVVSEGVIDIIISDNGKGIEKDKLGELRSGLEDPENPVKGSPKGSIGLYNINRRVKLNFGDQYGISIANAEAGGAMVTVRIPAVR